MDNKFDKYRSYKSVDRCIVIPRKERSNGSAVLSNRNRVPPLHGVLCDDLWLGVTRLLELSTTLHRSSTVVIIPTRPGPPVAYLQTRPIVLRILVFYLQRIHIHYHNRHLNPAQCICFFATWRWNKGRQPQELTFFWWTQLICRPQRDRTVNSASWSKY